MSLRSSVKLDLFSKLKSIPVEIKILILLLLLLLFWFTFSFTSSLASPPSQEMSRELSLKEFDYGFSKTINSHVFTLNVPGKEEFSIISVDGKRLQILNVDIRGDIQNQITLDLDMSQASQISGYYLKQDSLRLFYKATSLRQADIDLKNGTYTVTVIEETLRDYESEDSLIIIRNPEGLFYRDTSRNMPMLPLLRANVLTFQVDRTEDEYYILSVHKDLWNTVDIHLTQLNSETGSVSDTLLYEGVAYKDFRDLSDMKIQNGTMTSLYKYRDRRNGLNRLTIQKIDLKSQLLIQESHYSAPLYNSRFTLIQSRGDEIRFIHQVERVNGVNLGISIINPDGTSSIHDITKTKSMSKLAGYVSMGDYHSLVFSDINYERRALFYATDLPELMKATTRLSTIPFWYTSGTTLILFFVSLISGGLYLLAQIPFPAALTFLIDRFENKTGKDHYTLYSGIILIFHTVLKLFLTAVMLSYGQNYLFRPRLIDQPQLLYITLCLLSIIAYFLARKSNHKNRFNNNRCMSFYYRFSLMDYLMYVPIFLIYMISSILLSKI